MNRSHALKDLAGLTLCPLCKPAFAAEGAHWSYEGAGGPAKWGDLAAANKACAVGLQQSPIDIEGSIKSHLPVLTLNWGKSGMPIPATDGPAVKADAGIDPHALLPTKLSYFRYPGSLTTPPCSEVVEWLLLTDPIQVSAADIAAFAKLYPMNARPVQKDNRRYVLKSI